MPVIIAECCQNHKGDLSLLKDMIWAARDAGADYVKIQSMLADELAVRPRFEDGVVEDGVTKVIKRPWQPEYDRLKPMDLDDDAHRWFVEECGRAGIAPLTTSFTRSRVPFLATLPWPAIKVASYDCASLPLLRDLKASFPLLFISTGATTDDEIAQAAALLGDHPFSLLHCVTVYPTPLDQLHLGRMDWLRQFTPSVGFSDHTLVGRDSLKASFAALASGADVIERHYTLLAPDETRDGPVSINAPQLAELVAFARLPREEQRAFAEREIPEFAAMQGESQRPMTHAELLNRDYYRGRFATRTGDGWTYNWEEDDAG